MSLPILLNSRMTTSHGVYYALISIQKTDRVLLADGPPYRMSIRFWERGQRSVEMKYDVDPEERNVDEVALEMAYDSLDRWVANHRD